MRCAACRYALSQAQLYDAWVQHGEAAPDSQQLDMSANGIAAWVSQQLGGSPKQGVNETAWLEVGAGAPVLEQQGCCHDVGCAACVVGPGVQHAGVLIPPSGLPVQMFLRRRLFVLENRPEFSARDSRPRVEVFSWLLQVCGAQPASAACVLALPRSAGRQAP